MIKDKLNKPSHKRWEYLVKRISLNSDQVSLEELGKEGWELCSVVYLNYQFTYYFKREIVSRLNYLD